MGVRTYFVLVSEQDGCNQLILGWNDVRIVCGERVICSESLTTLKAKSDHVFGQERKQPKMSRPGLYARVSTEDLQTDVEPAHAEYAGSATGTPVQTMIFPTNPILLGAEHGYGIDAHGSDYGRQGG